jgi:predicted GNAT family N-acyltransferase
MKLLMEKLALAVVNYPEAQEPIQTIRHWVFQIEQGVDPDLDFDGRDPEAMQILALVGDQPVGTARVRDLGDRTVKIERLAVLKEFRGRGIGRKIMEFILEVLQQRQIQTVQLHAQLQAKALYDKLGFVAIGDVFIEAGIPHIKMQKQLQ